MLRKKLLYGKKSNNYSVLGRGRGRGGYHVRNPAKLMI